MIRAIIAKRFGSSRPVTREVLEITEQQYRKFYPLKNTPALFSLRARIGLQNMELDDIDRATRRDDESFQNLYQQGKSMATNVLMKTLKSKYPNMPDNLRSVGLSEMLSNERMHKMALKFGLQHVILSEEKLCADQVFSLIGMVEKQLGKERCEKFVEAYFSHLDIDWKQAITIDRPDIKLNEIVTKLYNTEPVTRLLAESGRESPLPIFTVGVFAKNLKLAEGLGQSISMAQHNARLNALMAIYLKN